MALKPLVIRIFGKDLTKGLFSGLGKDIHKTGRKIQGLGKKMSLGLSVPLGIAGIASIKLSNDLNAAMASVSTLIPGNEKKIRNLKKEVQALAIETGKSTDDIAGGLFQVISAFGDEGAETLKKLRINARAAVAGIAETRDAINLTSLVTKAYGDTTAKATQHVSDLAFKANELGQTTFPEMAASLGKAVPFAQTLGVSLEELFGVMGTFTGVTGNTSEVTTQLTGFLGAMLKPTEKMSLAFKILGVRSGKELIKKFNGVHGAMKALVRITEPYPGILGKVLGRKEALNLVLAATGKQSEKFAEKVKKMGKVANATETAFTQQTDKINKNGFALKRLGVRLVVLGQKMGDILGTALIPLISFLEKLTIKFDALTPSSKKMVIALGAIAFAIPPLIFLIGSLAIAVNAAGWPVLLITLGIFLLIGAVGILVIKFKEVMAWFRKMPLPIMLMLGPLMVIGKTVQILTDHWTELIETFKSAWNWVKKLGNLIPATFTGNSKAFEEFSSATDRLGNAWEALPIADAILGKREAPKPKSVLGPGMGPLKSFQGPGFSKRDPVVKIDFLNMPPGATVTTTDKDNVLDITRGPMTAGQF